MYKINTTYCLLPFLFHQELCGENSKTKTKIQQGHLINNVQYMIDQFNREHNISTGTAEFPWEYASTIKTLHYLILFTMFWLYEMTHIISLGFIIFKLAFLAGLF